MQGSKNSFAVIHSIIASIPAGKVATYGQIAAMAGNPRGARTVVWAIYAPTEDALPYHRVVAKTGRLAPEHVFGGCDIQRDMLEAEGVTFLPDGSIDMERHLWRPD
ncbi:MAG TPA: MGMT family protein [Bacillota bacterium]|nr:MGMT family protein [Bacillota bacterium]